MKTKGMNYLSVLDHEKGQVYMYTIGADGWSPDDDSCKGYLVAKGHNLMNCQWMCHEENNIITN
jgi:hypothetical protein